MTPEEIQRLINSSVGGLQAQVNSLQQQVQEMRSMRGILATVQERLRKLMDWKRQREIQSIPEPLDEASRNVLGLVVAEGNGSSALTQSIGISSTPTAIDVPAALQGTVIIDFGGTVGRLEIGYIQAL